MPRDRDRGALPPLRDLLTARGAKPHSRMSDLSRYMLDHRDELHDLLAEGFAWADIAALLATEEGLVDKRGQPITAALAKLTWSRTRKRQRAAMGLIPDRTGPVVGDGPMAAPHATDAAGMPTLRGPPRQPGRRPPPWKRITHRSRSPPCACAAPPPRRCRPPPKALSDQHPRR
jgi:hypothetical protein